MSWILCHFPKECVYSQSPSIVEKAGLYKAACWYHIQTVVLLNWNLKINTRVWRNNDSLDSRILERNIAAFLKWGRINRMHTPLMADTLTKCQCCHGNRQHEFIMTVDSIVPICPVLSTRDNWRPIRKREWWCPTWWWPVWASGSPSARAPLCVFSTQRPWSTYRTSISQHLCIIHCPVGQHKFLFARKKYEKHMNELFSLIISVIHSVLFISA